ncbi:ABC transporter substrate-binding protein [Bradyrhizobium sp. AZCC 2289]|uniref:ABC transporter substrate-binding protein n=1 Tax=Bradyrhizobium sp. AZCC 2289 TaxID=3117026 RepID=UPI002FF123CC
MKRREFIGLLGGAAASWPLPARAQQPGKLPTIGFLGAATPAAWSAWTAGFVGRLGQLGWIENRTVAIEYRWAEGRTERYGEIASEFARLKVDVIVTVGSAAVAVKQVTSVIPIVFAVAPDPLGTGLVTSLSRPGGNVTGVSNQSADLADKRLEILRELLPRLRRLLILANAGNPTSMRELHEIETTARKLGLEAATLEIRRADDLEQVAFEPPGASVTSALYAVSDPLVIASRARINTLAQAARLPTMYAVRDYVDAGGLMSYGPNYANLFSRAGDFVDKILRGAKPGDLPVEQPTKFELVINLKTAKALGLELSPSLLTRADEVIE